MNINNILISTITAFLGGIIGTYCGAYFIDKKQDKYHKNIRKIALRALDLFEVYCGRTYKTAEDEFNIKFNITEKRIILVALYKIGIPVYADNIDGFDIENVVFKEKPVVEDEIMNMKIQIEHGNCDNLFFEEPEDYFNKNTLNIYKRKIAIKFIDNVLSKTKVSDDVKRLIYPENWWDKFSPGEINIALIFAEKLAGNQTIIDKNLRQINQERVAGLVKEINRGLWDTYLDLTHEKKL